jgi:organic radical activating enzyme
MSKKYFPIRTDTSCQLKWNWSTLYLHKGNTASCHRTGSSQLSAEDFINFHNTDKKQRERSQMLKGQWPTDSCQYCKNIEDSGGFSDRMLHLQIPDMVPPELEDDPSAISVSPTILEVYFDNKCNLSCLYCIPELSSKIQQENVKFGLFESHGVTLEPVAKDPGHATYVDLFWQWMQDHSKKLRRFNVLGGEPFYQAEFYQLIDYLEQTPHPDLELGIVTNLMIAQDKMQDLIQRFKNLLVKKHVKRIDITASIDCWGSEQEYVRHGLNLERWQSNFETLLENRWLTVNINQTISVLTIKTMPDLLSKLKSWRNQRPVGHFFSEVSPQPSYLMPHILGPGLFDQDFERIISLMPKDTKQDRISVSYMSGIRDHIENNKPNSQEKLKLRVFLDEKDRRRNTNWRQVFPWLTKEIDHVV